MRYKSRSRALAASALAATVGLAGLGLVAPAAGAAPAETDRIAGVNRYETAADIAQLALPNADTVVLTTGEKLPDALSANPIAGAEDAPILLTLSDSIPTFTQQALDAIDPTNVIIVGGTSAVSTAVENELEADGFTVTREAGVDRFETAAEVAREVGVAPDIDPDGTGGEPALATVAIANGLTGLPDAVAASPMLHQMDIPLLLTGPDTLNEDAAQAIEDLGAEQALLLGGTAAISNAIEQGLEADGINAERLAGTDRWGTAAAIADFEIDRLGFDAATTYIASGFSLADALAGGPLASVTNSPIVLVSETSVPAPTARWIEDNAAEIDEIIALGGTAVINGTVLAETAELADEGDAGQVTLTSGSVQQGGNVTGTIAGDVQTATVSGCGLTNQPLADQNAATAGLQFTVPIAATQAAGACTLTFTVTNADGTTVTETESVTVTAAPVAPGTSRPELVSARIVSTTTPGQATATQPAGTVVAYTFDEPVVATTPTSFNVYSAAAAQTVSAAGNVSVSAADNRTVDVLFPGITSATAAGQLTTATVELGAVTDAAGQTSPEGDAAIGTGGQATLTAGTTSAPDVVSVAGFRGTTVAGTVAVDFTFDQAAFAQGAGGFQLVATDGRVVTCAAPGAATSGNTTPSGLNIPGGNGTTVITVTCGQFAPLGPLAATTASAANVARGVVMAGTVGTTPPVAAGTVNGVTAAACGAANADPAPITNRCNPLQATNTPDTASAAPDLVSATFTISTNPAVQDQVLYTFDENVVPASVVPAGFGVYNTNGGLTAGGIAGTNAPQVNGAQVVIFFPFGTLSDEVGANVAPASVAAVAGTNMANGPDEVGVANPTATTVTPGRTAAPDLTGVALSSTTVGFITTWTATYTFDEALGAGTTAAGVAPQLFLHLADGSRLACTGLANVTIGNGLNGLTTSQVSCNNFTFVAGQAGTNIGPATPAQIGSAVLGTVNQFAPTAAGQLADAGGTFTPEGAERTTGGTGVAV